MNHANRITALALGVAGVLAMGQVNAAGFQLRETSVKNLGRGQAGVATARNDASVVSNNPAAMVNLDKTTLQADVTAIDLTAEFSGSAHTSTGATVSGGNGGDPGSMQAVPNLAAVFPMHGALEGLTLGASIGAPFGLKTEYDPDWVGRYNAVESDLKTVDLTLSAAIKLHDRFSVGVGFIYERADVTLSNTVDYGTLMASAGAAPAAARANRSFDGLAVVEGDSTGIGWLFGAQWKPTDKLSIGYSHRSEVDHDIEGDAVFNAPAAFTGAQPAFRLASTNPLLPAAVRQQLAVLGNGFVPTDAAAALTTPSVDIVSFQYDFTDSFRLMADYQKTDWHSLRSINIDFANAFQPNSVEDFSWRDSEMVALGGEWDMSDSFTLRGGLTLDETPTHDDTRTPRLPDEDRRLYSIGFTWNVSDAFSVDAAYQRIEIDESKIDAHTSLGTVLSGEFDGHADLYGVSAQYRF